MSKIRILSKELADKIAAGEVVERPASVVKELLENSLDAGSTNIEVIIENSGRKSITVIDNGQGISVDDLQIAYKRHATSKINTDADLNAISTLGFRGEALASIAAISFMRISSCSGSTESAKQVEIEAGVFKGMCDTARTQGTTVEVRNIFFNTPARLKFLKSDTTEMFHIIRTVTELSLAYPKIGFKLIHSKQEIINVKKNDTLYDRVTVLIGDELAKELRPISFNIAPLQIYGLVSKAGFGQSSRKNQYFFVNKRPVFDRTIMHALIQGYHTFLADKQFPAVFIFIDTPAELVDVNVHPNKREVRFRQGQVLHDVLVKVIKDKLTDKADLPRLKQADQIRTIQELTDHKSSSSFKNSEGTYSSDLEQQQLFPSIFEQNKQSFLPELKSRIAPFLQVENTYIVLQDIKGVIIIDQHAAHERILFDELRLQFEQKRVEKQNLLLPVTLNVNKAQSVLLTEFKNLFQELGFDVEEFGGQTFAIHSYPAVLGDIDIKNELEGMIVEIANLEISPHKSIQLTQFLATVACHSAVRAGQKLSAEQIASVIDRLWKTTAPHTCPHGRPTIINISWNELEKKFKRK